MDKKITNVPGRLHNVAVDEHGNQEPLTGANEIMDDALGKMQNQINAEVEQSLGPGGGVDSRIANAVNTEKSRAEGVEGELNTRITTEISRATTAEENLRQLYNSLSQSHPIPVTQLPATGETGKIYRLAGTTSYADYMWNGTQFIKMAEYDNALDEDPDPTSNNLVKSVGIYNFGLATEGIDVSKTTCGAWNNGNNNDTATFDLDETGHNGTWNLLQASSGSKRIRMDVSNLTDDSLYRISFDFATSNNLSLSSIGKGASATENLWNNLKDIYKKNIYTDPGKIDFIFKKTSDIKYLLIAHNASGLTFPITATVSNFRVEKYYPVKDIDKQTDDSPHLNSNKFVRSKNVANLVLKNRTYDAMLTSLQQNLDNIIPSWQTNAPDVWDISDVDGKNATFTNISKTNVSYVGLDFTSIQEGMLVHIRFKTQGINAGDACIGGFNELAYEEWHPLKDINNRNIVADSDGIVEGVFKKDSTNNWLIFSSKSFNTGTVIVISEFSINKVYNKIVPTPSSIIPSNYTYENYMSINSVNQGSCIYGNYFFGASAADSQGNLTIKVYDLETKTLVDTLTLTNVATNTHANTISFGRKYNEEDEFPCLYIPTGYTNDGMSDVYVCRITGEIGNLSIAVVQTIHLWNVWTEWVCSDNNIAWIKIGNNANMRFMAYNIPEVNQLEVTIDKNSPIVDFTIAQQLGYNVKKSDNQDFMYNKGRIWFVSGVPSRDSKDCTFIGVVNVRNQCLETVVWLDDVGLTNGNSNVYEPEGIFIWNNHLYVAFNSFIAKIKKVDLV